MSNNEIEDTVKNIDHILQKLKLATEVTEDDPVVSSTASTDSEEYIKTLNRAQQLLLENMKIKDEPEVWDGSFETIRASNGGPIKLIFTSNESIRVGKVKGLNTVKYEENSPKEKVQSKSWECSHCLKKFASGSSLSRHTKNCKKKDEVVTAISGVKRSVFPCLFPDCGQEFGRKSTLKRHVLLKHSQIKMFICNVCKMAFALATDLARHEKSTHTKEGAQCSKCGSLFSRLDNLKRHETTVCLKRRRSEKDTPEEDTPEENTPEDLLDLDLSPLSNLSEGVFSPATIQTADEIYAICFAGSKV